MMTRVMTVEAGGQMFGIPLDAVVETVRIRRERIHPIGRRARFRAAQSDHSPHRIGHERWAGAVTAHLCPTRLSWSRRAAASWRGFEVDRFGERMDVMLKPPERIAVRHAGNRGHDAARATGACYWSSNLQEVLR